MEWDSIFETKTFSKQLDLTEGQDLTSIKAKLLELAGELPDQVPPKIRFKFVLSIKVVADKK